jgi:sulfite reductase (NADPH) flavoprotein alpha-component
MSFIAPILPDNSPFSPLQRAWLDGYLAALFADEAPAPSVIAPQPQASQAEAEDFPWHDPALPLDDRLALAAAQPIEHRLMAAMGQLDCGQCGYLCRSYAEAS